MAAPAASGAAAAATASADGSTSGSSGNPFRDFLEQQQGAAAATTAGSAPAGLCPTGSAPVTVDTTLPVRWMKQEKNGAWVPLRRRDSARIEAAYLAWKEGEGEGAAAPTVVTIEGHRYEADIPKREIRATYWDKDSKPLLRASWFSKPATAFPGSGPNAFTPYSEADAALIEEAYQAALDETIRSLAAGSFLSPSQGGGEQLSASTSQSAAASTSGGRKGGAVVLLRKEMPLGDGTNKVVITVRESPAASLSTSKSSSTTTIDATTTVTATQQRSTTNKLGLALLPPNIEVDVSQQRVQYGIGVLHNRVLRRGIDPSLEPTPTIAAGGEGQGQAPVGVEGSEEEEEDEFDREPSHLVFVVHGIGEKMWASETIQGALSLRASVEVMRANVAEQQARVLNEMTAAADPTVPPCSQKKGGVCRGGRKNGSEAVVEEGANPPPSEEATETAPADADGEATSTSQTPKPKKEKKKRVEFVPVEWFDAIWADDSLTRRTQRVTLQTVPLFRQLANDVVMDVLLYMNPSHRQRILAAVGERMNRAYQRFKEAHPNFSGEVSVVGHSLGSVILLDLLAHQRGQRDDRVFSPLDSAIHYPQLQFPVDLFMTMGSPIGLFLVVREQELPPTFQFPTVARFYNVFHPFDPVAYRIEPILQPAMAQLDPALVPHHATGAGEKTFVTKAREHKRLVQGNLAALGSTVSSAGRSLLTSLSSLATPRATFAMGVGKEEAGAALLAGTGGDVGAMGVAMADLTVGEAGGVGGSGMDESAAQAEPRVEALRLNGGRRFDFAIQEGVGESLNEYISAISSHACYFAHPDIAYFLVRLLHRLEDDNGDASASAASSMKEEGAMRV